MNGRSTDDSVTISLRVDKELRDAIKAMAEAEHRSINNFFNVHLERDLANAVEELKQKLLGRTPGKKQAE
jgi:hypothetical protein